jgi:hypothetical protein
MLLPKYMKINAGIAVLFLLVCVLINIGTLVAYRRRQRYQQQQQNAESETIQRKLLIYSLTTFFGHVLVALLMVSRFPFENAKSLFLQELPVIGAHGFRRIRKFDLHFAPI